MESMPTWKRSRPRWQNKLVAGKESAYLSYTLAAIRIDLPVTLNLAQARIDAFDPAKVEAIFARTGIPPHWWSS